MIQIHGIKLKAPVKGDPGRLLLEKAAARLRVPANALEGLVILKESVDAREKPDVYRVYSLAFSSAKGDEWLLAACRRAGIRAEVYAEDGFEIERLRSVPEEARPVVAGFGPCGMFAALALAKMGLKPVVIERGGCMEERVEAVEAFWAGGRLDPECNVQFGEGGAGTFSDGKLTTGTKSPWSRWILKSFVRAGAAADILYLQRPHIGTDVLRKVVVNIRKEIVSLGGEILFNTRLTSFETDGGKVTTAVCVKKDGEELTVPCSALILAIGHSARDTMKMLLGSGLALEQKPFSIGLRIEHPQRLIDIAQYGSPHEELGLGPADYKLNVRTSKGRGVYTFCMCPGGFVVNSSSEPGAIVTNGMSNSGRDSGTANSALLADVLPEDYGPDCLPEGVDPRHPLAGAALQEKYERLAFELGGGKGLAPSQTVGEFLSSPAQPAATIQRESPGSIENTTDPESSPQSLSPSSFLPGTAKADLSKCLPDFAAEALREALPLLGKKLKGFDSPDAVLTGVESRSSSPVRIRRDPKTLQALAADETIKNLQGLYPAGEGAGYAGGIMSAASDGVRIALAIADQYQMPPSHSTSLQ